MAVDITKVTPEQEYVPEGTQCDKFKKLIQVPLYDFRNEMLHFISENPTED